MLVRSDNIGSLNPAGRAAMAAYGVTTVIDLRTESEVATSPGPFAAAGGEIKYLHRPMVDDSTMYRLGEAPGMFERYLMMLDLRPAALSDIFSAMAQAEGAVVFHCFAGKDRTGMVAAMSLALADVELDAIAADYAETDTQMAARYQEWLAEASPDQLEVMRQDLQCPPERIVGVLEYLGQRWGGVDGYLEAAGVGPADITRLASKLT